MPADDKSDSSVSSGRTSGGSNKEKSSSTASIRRRKSDRLIDKNVGAVTNQPGTSGQPLCYPGIDMPVLTKELPFTTTEAVFSENSLPINTQGVNVPQMQGFDIALLLRQQMELLKQLQPQWAAAVTLPPSRSITTPIFSLGQGVQTSTSASVPVSNNNTSQSRQNIANVSVSASPAAAGNVQNQPVVSGDDQVGLISALNNALATDTSIGEELDPDIAELIENCLNLPNATPWDEMQAIRDVYKCPSNCPSLVVPLVNKSMYENMTKADEGSQRQGQNAQIYTKLGCDSFDYCIFSSK